MKLYQILLCFKENSFNGNDIVKLLEQKNFLGFEPKIIRSRELNLNGKKYDQKHLLKIKELKVDFNISLESKDFTGPKFSITHPAHSNPPQVFYWLLPIEQIEILDYHFLLNTPQFVVGYIFDSEYASWESEEFINNYKFWNREYAHLPKIYDADFNEYKIDISLNPGRMKLVSGMWLISCWKMFFGKEFFKYVPKEKILDFPKLFKKEEYNENLISIQLYENIEQSDTKNNRNAQGEFRKWIGIDELEKVLK